MKSESVWVRRKEVEDALKERDVDVDWADWGWGEGVVISKIWEPPVSSSSSEFESES